MKVLLKKIMNIKFNKSLKRRGFTLLEALMAISILMVAVVAPITIAQKGLSSASYSKNQMIASYLAQDAIEYIKNVRDTLNLNEFDINWAGFRGKFTQCIGVNNSCQINTISGAVDNYDDGSYLAKDNNGFYVYNNNLPATIFKRRINMILKEVPDNSGNLVLNHEALITVTVEWGAEDKVIVKTLIYNF